MFIAMLISPLQAPYLSEMHKAPKFLISKLLRVIRVLCNPKCVFKRPLRDSSMSGMTGMELRFESGTESEGSPAL